MADWNLPPLSAMGFTPYQPPPSMPDIPPEMLLQLLGNRQPSPLGFGSLQHLLGAGGQPDLQNPMPPGPPPIAGAPPPTPLSLGGQFADIVNPPTPNALMPQSRFEQTEQDRSNRQVGAVGDVAGIAAPFAIPGGAIMRGAGALARGAGNLVARSPAATAATAAATAGGATMAGTGQAEPPSELDTVTTTLTRLRTRQTELETADGELRTRGGLFDGLREGDAERIRRAQAALNIKQDGRLGPETRSAIERERRRIEEARATNKADREAVGRDITEQTTRAAALRRQGNRDTAEANMPWYDRFVRQYAGPLGMVAGTVGGAPFAFGARRAAVRGTNAAMERHALEMNALLDRPRRDISGRMAGVNRFYDEGGGREPFRLAPTGRGGFTETGPMTRAGDLFPPLSRRDQLVQPIDYGVGLGAGGIAGLAEYRLRQSQSELEEARNTANANGSPENLERLRRAESRYDWLLVSTRALQTAPLTYPVAAARYRYQSTRPDVQRAEAEVGRLSAWRRRQ